MPAVRRTVRRRTRKAFTLLEMMLVVVIIGLLVGVAVLNLTGQSKKARVGTTEASLRTIQNAVIDYYNTNGSYPASIVVMVPGTLPKVFKDAWKQDFVYYVTPQDPARPYALFSMGEDQLANTADDINVWNIGE